jgi:hypothetical protein
LLSLIRKVTFKKEFVRGAGRSGLAAVKREIIMAFNPSQSSKHHSALLDEVS